MVFGYIPDFKNKNPLIDTLLKIIGLPILHRRIQARSIIRMLKGSNMGKMMDLCCGDGIFSIEFAKRGWNYVIGIDIDKESIKLGKKRSKIMKLENVEFILCDAECLPLKNECFNVVLCNCALEHIKNDEKAIEETYRVLVKNGIFILTVPSEKRRIILPLISFWIHMPKTLRKILAPKYLWEDAKTPEEAIWRLKKERFKEYRNYPPKGLFKLLEEKGFKICEWEYNIKLFGALMWDLILGIRLIHLNMGMIFMFPIMFPISLLDEILPKHFRGEEFAVKAIK